MGYAAESIFHVGNNLEIQRHKMTGNKYPARLPINSWFVLGLFWIAVLFQLTAFKEIWSIQMFSRIANSVALFVLYIYAFKTLVLDSFSRKIWYYYIFPGTLVFIGLIINFGLNAASNLELLAYFGFTLPWAAYLAIPGLMKRCSIDYKLLWRYFYYFMLASIVLGLLDNWMYSNGWLDLRVLKTKYGPFLGGWFSIYYMLADGTPHYRFYADFIEPGSLAMWLLPVMAYAFLSKRYIGLVVLSVGLFLTNSLGGWISLFLLIGVVFFIQINHKSRNKYTGLVVTMVLLIFMLAVFTPPLIAAWDKKVNSGASATTRIENVYKAGNELPSLILRDPAGINLAINTSSNMKNKAYIGSNFMPVVYFQDGGILALGGYIAVLLLSFLVSIKSIQKHNLSLEEKVVFSSIVALMPFVVQRTTIYESAVFAFLYAPVMIGRLMEINYGRVTCVKS